MAKTEFHQQSIFWLTDERSLMVMFMYKIITFTFKMCDEV